MIVIHSSADVNKSFFIPFRKLLGEKKIDTKARLEKLMKLLNTVGAGNFHFSVLCVQ